MVEDEVEGVAREVDGVKEGMVGEVEAREEILSEGVTVREPINTTAEILLSIICILSCRAFHDSKTCNSIVRIQPAKQEKEK